jgi:hypothetical protein
MSLDLPTYKNFTYYSYYDVFSALALRLTVYDSVKKEKQEIKYHKVEES